MEVWHREMVVEKPRKYHKSMVFINGTGKTTEVPWKYAVHEWAGENREIPWKHWQKGEDSFPDHRNSTILFHPRHTLNAVMPKNKMFQKLERLVMKTSKRKRRKI